MGRKCVVVEPGGFCKKVCNSLNMIVFDQGPFKDIPSFNAALTDAARPYFRWNLLSIVQRSLARTDSYRIVFTHGDLHNSNIMVRQSMSPSESDEHVTGGNRWMVVALVDWWIGNVRDGTQNTGNT